jgi:hypothetical protein
MSGIAGRLRRPICPSRETLVGALLEELPAGRERRFLDHLAVCERCRSEYAILREVDAAGRDTLGDLGAALDEAGGERVRDLAAREVRRLDPERPFAAARTAALRKLVPAAALVLAVAAAGVFLLRREPGRLDGERMAGPEQVRLIRPLGKSAAARLEFVWSAVPGAACALTVYSKALEPLIVREGLEGGRLVLSEKELRLLVPGEAYFWRVSARLPAGRTVNSEFVKFSIRADRP